MRGRRASQAQRRRRPPGFRWGRRRSRAPQRPQRKGPPKRRAFLESTFSELLTRCTSGACCCSRGSPWHRAQSRSRPHPTRRHVDRCCGRQAHRPGPMPGEPRSAPARLPRLGVPEHRSTRQLPSTSSFRPTSWIGLPIPSGAYPMGRVTNRGWAVRRPPGGFPHTKLEITKWLMASGKLSAAAKRATRIMVTLNDDEVAVLDERPGAVPRATYLRQTLHSPSRPAEIATRSGAPPASQSAREGPRRCRSRSQGSFERAAIAPCSIGSSMAEINRPGIADESGLHLALTCGAVEGDRYTDAQLMRAWRVFGNEIMSGRNRGRPGEPTLWLLEIRPRSRHRA